MVLIIGGAYQGKRDYAKENFSLRDRDIFDCTGSGIDLRAKCICGIERFTREHDDPVAYFSAHRDAWEESVLIVCDISCGVVPMGAENRAWQRKNGELCRYLAREASKVVRIFCGLEQRLK